MNNHVGILSTGAGAPRHRAPYSGRNRVDADRIVGWDRRLLPQASIMDRRVLPKHLRKRKR